MKLGHQRIQYKTRNDRTYNSNHNGVPRRSFKKLPTPVESGGWHSDERLIARNLYIGHAVPPILKPLYVVSEFFHFRPPSITVKRPYRQPSDGM